MVWLSRLCFIVVLMYDLIRLVVENERSLRALVAGITMMREETQQTSLKKLLASGRWVEIKLHSLGIFSFHNS